MNRIRVQNDNCPTIKPKEEIRITDSGGIDARHIASEKLVRVADGNLLTSYPSDLVRAAQGFHLPIFDLDVPHTLVASQTPGHGHLYIHKYVHASKLRRIMHALNDAGLCGRGNIAQFEGHGMQLARVPFGYERLDEIQSAVPEAPHEPDHPWGAF